MSRRGLDCRVHLPQFPGVNCPVPCNRYTALLALTLPSVEVLIVCVVECSRCCSVFVVKKKEVWDKPNPKKKSTPLTDKQKASAKARAKKAGRPYPNLVDNMAASRSSKGK